MGRNTWEFCETLDSLPYLDKECFLVSDTRSDATNLESVDWNRNVWIVGGPNVVSSALSFSYGKGSSYSAPHLAWFQS